MKWSIYKKMSKEHKEEYNYRFSGDFWWIGQCVFAAVALLSNNKGILFLFGVLSLTMWILPEYAEYKWLKQKGYITEEKFLGLF